MPGPRAPAAGSGNRRTKAEFIPLGSAAVGAGRVGPGGANVREGRVGGILKFFGSVVGIIFLIGLIVVVGLLMLIF